MPTLITDFENADVFPLGNLKAIVLDLFILTWCVRPLLKSTFVHHKEVTVEVRRRHPIPWWLGANVWVMGIKSRASGRAPSLQLPTSDTSASLQLGWKFSARSYFAEESGLQFVFRSCNVKRLDKQPSVHPCLLQLDHCGQNRPNTMFVPRCFSQRHTGVPAFFLTHCILLFFFFFFAKGGLILTLAKNIG